MTLGYYFTLGIYLFILQYIAFAVGVSLVHLGLPWWLSGKESACSAGDAGSIPGSGKILWRRKRQPTPVFLPGKSHGRKSLAGYSPWGHKELDTT